jgi:hydrogenase nickel incorporation protein HypA/HybF
MHEMAIARSIVEIAVAAAEGGQAQQITRVNVVAGELRGIVPLQLTFCFGVMAENTLASGAQLNLEIAPVRGECKRCSEAFVVKDFEYVCPQCESREVQITGGTELRVRDIEVA